MIGIIGKKVGMTRIFDETGISVPVIVIDTNSNYVTQLKTEETDGYNSVQIGFDEVKEKTRNVKVNGKAKKVTNSVNRPYDGHFRKAGTPVLRHVVEFRVDGGTELEPGQQIGCDVIEKGSYVDVMGTSKGKGFAGVMKRHNFKGGCQTHGNMNHRGPGSIGQSSDPSRVWPGMKMAGQMGNRRVTQQNLQVAEVDTENGLVLIKGTVPGANNCIVTIRPAKKK